MPPSVQLRGRGSQHPSQAPGGLMASSAGERWGGSEGTNVLCLLHPTSFLQVPTEDFRALPCLNSIHLQLGNPNSPSVPHRAVSCRSLVTFKIPGLLSKQETPNTIDVVPSTTVTWTHFCPHLTGEQTGTGRGVMPWSVPLSWPWGVSCSPANMGLRACIAAALGGALQHREG